VVSGHFDTPKSLTRGGQETFAQGYAKLHTAGWFTWTLGMSTHPEASDSATQPWAQSDVPSFPALFAASLVSRLS
jgi:hypothetical protein